MAVLDAKLQALNLKGKVEVCLALAALVDEGKLFYSSPSEVRIFSRHRL
jgi:hypothetical protein